MNAIFTRGVDSAQRSLTSQREPLGMHILLGPRKLTVASTPLGNAVRFVLVLLPVTVFLAAGCRNPNAAPAIPSPEVEVASVVQKDVPIYSEWVATLDGYVNAQIQAQAPGYIIQQTYKEGSFVRKGQLLFQIDPRPFQNSSRSSESQLAQAQAQLGKTEMDVDRDTPLAKERAIAQSQLDNDVQANKAVKANGGAALPTIDSRGVPQCLGRSRGLPEDARSPYTGGISVPVSAGRGSSFPRSLYRRRYGLSGTLD